MFLYQPTRLFVAALSSALLAACSSGPAPVAMAPGIEAAPLDLLPAPLAPFALKPFDVVNIEVFGQDDLNREVEIGVEGWIDFPLIGKVRAAGLTAGDLQSNIADQLRGRYIQDPSVTVKPNRQIVRQLFVGGEVKKPGSYPYQSALTLSRVIFLAGGTAELAKLDDVLIQRKVGDSIYIGVYSLKAINRGNYADPEIYPDDTIYVGDSPERRRLLSALGVLQLVIQPLILLDRLGS